MRRILLRDGRNRGHFPMFSRAAQPAKKGTLQPFSGYSGVGDRFRPLSGLHRFGLRIGGSIVGFASAPMDATDVLTLRRPVHLPRRISHSI
jgi:hypothetical protein